MGKSISVFARNNWEELEYSPGELIAFDNSDSEWPHPFLIMKHERGACWHFDGQGSINFVYWPHNGERAERRVHPVGYALGLWPFSSDGEPIFEKVRDWPSERPYVVERAYAGRDAIIKALGEQRGYARYAEMIDEGTLITDNGFVGKLVERSGGRILLPNPVRFAMMPFGKLF